MKTVLDTAELVSPLRVFGYDVSPRDRGVAMARAHTSETLKRWQLRWLHATEAQAAALWDDYLANRFGLRPWTPPGGTELQVAYLAPPSIERVAAIHFALEAVLELPLAVDP